MVFSGYEHTGKAPFHTVLIHGLVRDSQGRKMSKSLGNGIDPLEIIDEYGADALRLTLVTGNAPGNDMRFYNERVESSRNFANKVWNASRFILMNMEDKVISKPDDRDLTMTDKWILSKVNTLAKDVTDNMDKFELGIAVQKVYDFIWDEFCDWYIELVKYRIYHSDENYKSANAALWTLKTVLGNALKMLHPFMPFVTEEIYGALVPEEESLMMSSWPSYIDEWNFPEAEKVTDHMKEVIRGVDYKTLLFFIGLFISVAGLEQTGVLKLIAQFISTISGGSIKVVILIILLLSAVCSALIDNIPFAATMVPVVQSIAATQGMDLSVLAWALSLGTDLGGNATPIGASANVVATSVSAKSGHPISWGKYCKYCVPATVLVVAVSLGCLFLRYL